MEEEKPYLSYLLRLWQESDQEPPLWRASLESPQADVHQGFARLEGLFAYLRERTGTTSIRTDAENYVQRPCDESDEED